MKGEKLKNKPGKKHTLKAINEYNKFVKANADRFNNEDVHFEPLNFKNWVMSCEAATRPEELNSKIDYLKQGIMSAFLSDDEFYCESREFYLRYAEEALRRRFPDYVIHPKKELPNNECPF